MRRAWHRAPGRFRGVRSKSPPELRPAFVSAVLRSRREAYRSMSATLNVTDVIMFRLSDRRSALQPPIHDRRTCCAMRWRSATICDLFRVKERSGPLNLAARDLSARRAAAPGSIPIARRQRLGSLPRSPQLCRHSRRRAISVSSRSSLGSPRRLSREIPRHVSFLSGLVSDQQRSRCETRSSSLAEADTPPTTLQVRAPRWPKGAERLSGGTVPQSN